MIVSSTEVQNNFGKYLKMVEDEEDIIITKNGKKVARLIAYREGDDYIIRESSSEYSHSGMRITYEEFKHITHESENRYEYINGMIYLLPSPAYIHQKTVGKLLVNIMNCLDEKDSCDCEPLISPFEITLYRQEDINVVQPDIIVFSDRKNINDDGRYQGTPGIVIEVLSEYTRSKDFINKLDLYMSSGVGEYWIVSPFSEEIMLYSFENGDIQMTKTYKNDDKISSTLFKELSISVDQVFR